MLEELKTESRVVGLKQTRRAVLSGSAKKVFLACDADPALTAPLISACKEKDIPFTAAPTMREIGETCGLAVGAAAAAALH